MTTPPPARVSPAKRDRPSVCSWARPSQSADAYRSPAREERMRRGPGRLPVLSNAIVFATSLRGSACCARCFDSRRAYSIFWRIPPSGGDARATGRAAASHSSGSLSIPTVPTLSRASPHGTL
jgi:hypothetical protein